MTPPLEEALTAMQRQLGLATGSGLEMSASGRGNRNKRPPHSRNVAIINQAMGKFFAGLPRSLQPVKDVAQALKSTLENHRSWAVRAAIAADLLRLGLTLDVSEDTTKRLRSALGEYPQGPFTPNSIMGIYTRAKSVTSVNAERLQDFFTDSISAGVAGTPLWGDTAEALMSALAGNGSIRGSPAPEDHSSGNSQPDSGGNPAGGGLTLPGYNYVGPGNPLDNGPPQGPVDEAAQRHDQRYDELLGHGDVPYLNSHGADQMMSEELKEAEEKGQLSNPVDAVVGNAARALWHAKDLANQVASPGLSQVLPPNPLPESGSLTPEPTGPPTPDSLPTGGPPPAKVARTDEAASPSINMSTLRAGNFDTQSSGGGVKVKSQWVGGTVFSDSTIHTSHTRISIIADRGSYQPIHQDGSTARQSMPAIGMKTPYSYVDVNALSAHFTPRDFQQLLDEYAEIRPKRLTVKLSGLVIKDVSHNNGTTQVTDSASGVMTVFADEDYDYPYVMGHNQDTIPGHLPGEHYVLPQYAYFTRGMEVKGGIGSITMIDDHNTSLYFLEHHDAECLSTGDSWEHSYDFPDVPFRRLTTPSQTLYARHNPLISSRMAIMTGIDNAQRVKWKRCKGLDVGELPQNHIPGPSINSPTDTMLANSKQDFIKPLAVGDPISHARHSVAPLINQPVSYREWITNTTGVNHTAISGYAYTRRQHEESYESYPAEDGGTVAQPSIPIIPEENLIGFKPGDSFVAPGSERVYPSDGTSGEPPIYNGKLYAEPLFPLLPGACWNPNPLSYDVQLWCKIPDTECNFMAEWPLLGGWATKHPPPMIFLRLRSQPGPPAEGAHTITGNTLGQYAFFNLHYEMEWEVVRRPRSRRHNPEKPAAFPTTLSGRMPFMLSRSAADTTTKYEVPENQWMGYNYSKLL
ncbi:capsid protein 1 [Opossum tetraparvovirus]|uniref:Capsid protein 1 n=1 Tax=Opossum tetraparvovirus TaxID=2137540 RepID=A0A2Z3D894_9VIRU|nr:capsid protein 1 [Opossum tetraparvovirus]AVR53745.1 capsid protein 1 [Opossum tetraparvovirus]